MKWWGVLSKGVKERGLWETVPFTTLDSAQHSWEKRQHVGRGVAGLNILWNMVEVRKDIHLQRLVELCILRALASCLKINESFNLPLVSSKPTPWNQQVPLCITSIICVLVLWHIRASVTEEGSHLGCWLLFRAAHKLCKPLRRMLHPPLTGKQQEGNLPRPSSAWGEWLGAQQCTTQ